MHTRILLTLACVFFGVGTVIGAPDAGKLREAATAGDRAAQVTLAHHYYCGGVVPRDPRAAYKWASSAAAAGEPVAAMMQGLILLEGDGRLADAEAAATAFAKAWAGGLRQRATTGEALAAAYCGVALMQGAGVAASETEAIPFLEAAADEVGLAKRELAFLLLTNRDRRLSLSEAVRMIEDAGETGDAQALFLSSDFYRFGRGVRRDDKRAERLLVAAARQGSASAQAEMARRALGDDPGLQQFRQAESWYRRAAEQGDAESQEALAWLLFNGSSGERNLREAAGWFGAAARGGRLSAQVQYARVLFEGLGRAPEPNEAAQWYRRAADAGNAEAQFMMAWMHFNGRGLSASETSARRWLAKAADAGHLLACFSYGSLLESGRGGEADATAARRYYATAARGGLPQAQFNYGMMVGEGIGGPADPVMASAWLTLAAENGVEVGRAQVETLGADATAVKAAVETLRPALTVGTTTESLLPAEAQMFAGYGRAGSGWVTDRGLVVTDARLVRDARAIRVHLSATDVRVASIERLDAVNGVALLRLSGARPKVGLSLRSGPPVAADEELAIAGYGSPNRIGLGPEVASGTGQLAAADVRVLELSTGYAATLAGGPVVDLRGEVVGVLQEVADLEGKGRAVRGSYVQALLALATDESLGRPGRRMKRSELVDWIGQSVVLVTVD